MVIFYNFCVGAALLGMSYSIGVWLRRKWFKDFFRVDPLILNIFLGVIFLTVIYALFKTSGVTILTGLILLGIVMVLYSKRFIIVANNYEDSTNIRFIDVVICFLFAFGYYNYTFHPSFDGGYATEDLSYYAKISEGLRSLGVETDNFYFLTDYVSVKHSFYHYFELWQAACIAQSFGITEFRSLVNIVLPFSGTILLLLVLSYLKNNSVKKPYFFLLLFISISSLAVVLKLIFPNSVLHSSGIFHDFSFKYLWIYICLFLWIIESQRGNPNSFIIGFILIFTYPPTSFVLVPGFFILLLKNLWQKVIKENILQVILLSSSVGFIILFYSIQPIQKVYSINFSFLEFVIERTSELTSIKEFKRSIGNCLEYLSYWIIPFITIFIILLISIKFLNLNHIVKKFVSLDFNVVVLSGSLISGSIWVIIFELKNSSQVLTNTLIPYLNIMLFLFILYSFLNNSSIKIVPIVIIFLEFSSFSYYQFSRVNTSSLNSISTTKVNSGIKNSIFFTDKVDYTDWMERGVVYRIPFPEIRRYTSSYAPICVTLENIPKAADVGDKYWGDNIIIKSPYYHFKKNLNRKLSDNFCRFLFIEKYSIQHFFFSKNFEDSSIFISRYNLKFVSTDLKMKFNHYERN